MGNLCLQLLCKRHLVLRRSVAWAPCWKGSRCRCRCRCRCRAKGMPSIHHFWESPEPGEGFPTQPGKFAQRNCFFLLFFCCVFFFSNKWKDIFFPLIFSGMIVGEANTFFSWGKSDNKGNKNIWGERRFHGKKLDKGNTVLGEASVEGKQCQHSWNSDVF